MGRIGQIVKRSLSLDPTLDIMQLGNLEQIFAVRDAS